MQIKQILVTKIDKYDKNKDGEDYSYVSKKDGKKHKFMRVIVNYEGGSEQISHGAFNPSDPILEWKPGEMHQVVLKQNGNYINFDEPSQLDMLEYRIELLESAFKSLQHNGVIDIQEEPEEENEEVEW